MSQLKKKISPYYRLVKRTIFCVISFLRIVIPARKNYWAFPVHFVKNSFCDNVEAVFEHVKGDPSIRKIIFTKGVKPVLENAVNVTLVNLYSFKAIWLLSQCKVIFIHHSLSLDFILKFKPYRYFLFKRAVVVNVWHGIPIKYIRAMLPHAKQLDEHKHFKLIVASSKIDRVVMATAFHPVPIENVFITGLPRNDYLLKATNELPSSMQKQLDTIASIKSSKKLLVYAPTYREVKKGGRYYNFSMQEIEQLKTLLQQNNAVLGLRPHHEGESRKQFKSIVDNEIFFDLGTDVIPEMNMLIRGSDLIITDYSSLFVDGLYMNKSMVCFAYDLEYYKNVERGLFYDFEFVFPGPVCQTFDALTKSLQQYFSGSREGAEKIDGLKKLFFDHTDSKNAERVTWQVKSMLNL